MPQHCGRRSGRFLLCLDQLKKKAKKKESSARGAQHGLSSCHKKEYRPLLTTSRFMSLYSLFIRFKAAIVLSSAVFCACVCVSTQLVSVASRWPVE